MWRSQIYVQLTWSNDDDSRKHPLEYFRSTAPFDNIKHLRIISFQSDVVIMYKKYQLLCLTGICEALLSETLLILLCVPIRYYSSCMDSFALDFRWYFWNATTSSNQIFTCFQKPKVYFAFNNPSDCVSLIVRCYCVE